MRTNSPISGRSVKGLTRPNRTYQGERRCSHPGCITKLSSYNAQETWFQTPRLRGRKVA